MNKEVLFAQTLEKVREKANIPVVMHEGSGVSREDFQKAIQTGVRKVNYYTYMAKAGGMAIKENIDDLVFYHDMTVKAIAAMKENAGRAMDVFAGV